MVSGNSLVKLNRLRSLASAPAAQAALALRLIESDRNNEVLLAALKVLAETADDAYRPLLRARYAHYAALPNRRDQGGTLRAAILAVLQPLAHHDDVPLFEQAVTTYEFLFGEAAGNLRAAGLLALSRADAELSGYHAVRLLNDQYTSIMNGEPAVTAARLLAAQRQLLPLYAYVIHDGERQGDVVAECLRSLVVLPTRLLPALVKRYSTATDEIILLGLFDLLLTHPARSEYVDLVFEFLATTPLLGIYRSLVMTLLVSRDEALIARLRALAEQERHPGRLAILREGLALRAPIDRP